MISSHESDGNSEKARAAGESVFVIMFVAEHVVDAAQSRDCTGPGECTEPNTADVHSAVFCRIRLQSNCAELVTSSCAKQQKPHRERSEKCDEDREICSRSVKRWEYRG